MRKQWLFVIISAVIVGILQFSGLPIQKFIRGAFDPIGKVFSDFGQDFGTGLRDFKKLGSLRGENNRLHTENLSLMAALADLEATKEENRQLRTQLGFAKTSGHMLIGADIVNFLPDNNRNKLRINRGASDGLKPGMAVVSGSVLVGVVDNVFDKSAEVLLVSDLNFRAVVMTRKHNATGIIKGEIGESVVMERIPQSQLVETGDLVITSGHDGVFPAGLLVGNVTSLSQVAGGVFKSAQVKPSLNPHDLKVLMVVVK